ncbi:hypothetical protein [Streptomyces sp. WM6386]
MVYQPLVHQAVSDLASGREKVRRCTTRCAGDYAEQALLGAHL